MLSQHIDWDLAETKGTGTEVIKWAQFGEPGQLRDKPEIHGHGYWHGGARVVFLAGTTEQFEIDFVYGVRATDPEPVAFFLGPVFALGWPLDDPGGPRNQLKKSQKAGSSA